MRVYIIGDIGGHVSAFKSALLPAGVKDGNYVLDEDVVVVQVGDLVHKGPSSDECVRLADELLRVNPTRYVQLIGNHDLAYLGGPRLNYWTGERFRLESSSVDVVRAWWADGRAKLAAVLFVDGRPTLVTHAGLTYGLWRALGSLTPEETVIALNRTVGDADSPAFLGGRLIDGAVNRGAGPCWAEVAGEVYLPWLQSSVDPGFDQVHGHAGPFNWSVGDFWPDCDEAVRRQCVRHVSTRTLETDLGVAGTAICVDWMLGSEPPSSIWPTFAVDGFLGE